MARYQEYDTRYRELQATVDTLGEENRIRQGRIKRFEFFMRALWKQHGELTAFDESTRPAVIETVPVKPDGNLEFRFATGPEIIK